MAYQPWMKLADLWWMDPKFSGLTLTHKGLYASLLGYARYNGTGGFIPADAIALCGRGARNRDKLVTDLVNAGLLVTTDVGTSFPHSYYKWSSKALKSPGQGGSSRAREEDKRRRSLYNSGSSSLAPAQVRPDEAMRAMQSLGPCSDCGMVNGNHLAECSTQAKKGKEGE